MSARASVYLPVPSAKKPQADRISSNHLPLPISIIKMVTIETAFLAPYPRLQGTRLKMVTNYTARLIIKNIKMVNWDAVGSSNFPHNLPPAWCSSQYAFPYKHKTTAVLIRFKMNST